MAHKCARSQRFPIPRSKKSQRESPPKFRHNSASAPQPTDQAARISSSSDHGWNHGVQLPTIMRKADLAAGTVIYVLLPGLNIAQRHSPRPLSVTATLLNSTITA
ncbi:protein of unknown function [Candidatus Filomicrobium marinum]|uniref:Uncharacterized protein n=1 Tax=Candidatus Filomicrobium marinum TaxID=1608628 RepID=A0A0D6JJ52_9HYPH|nr:protein of unknown function [Candidatus Filomicrobium marinum]CPR21725.1 protein of unknown function [Candidatus Filomicrobium marinum]